MYVEIDSYKHHHDHAFHQRLRNNHTTTILDGRFLWDKENWKKSHDIRKINLREKGVDVGLATSMIFDYFHSGAMELDLFVMSEDTDLVTAIKKIVEDHQFRDVRFYNSCFREMDDYREYCKLITMRLSNIEKFYDPSALSATSNALEALGKKFNSHL